MKKSAFVRLFLVLVAVSVLVAAKGPLVPDGSVVVVNLGGDIPEAVPFNPFMSLFQERKPVVLDKVLCLEQAAADKRVKGVVVRVADAGYGFAKAREFRSAIERYKKSGKPIQAVLELEGGGNIEYYLASACDKVYLSPVSGLNLTGLLNQRFYLGGLWEKLYVDMQVLKIREYKSMGDMLSREDMSKHEREMINSILDSANGRFISDIAKSRGVDAGEVRRWVDSAWLVADKYVEEGVVDGVRYLDEAASDMGDAGSKLVPESDYFFPPRGNAKSRGAVNVAVIYAVGGIITGDDEQGALGGSMVAADALSRRLIKAMEDDDIDAVILRIDSGGGSALASDLIWRAAERLKREKPLVVSMSDVAASGGYYIACNADAVVAQPGTITGSIGIVSAYPSFGKLLDKIGVGYDAVGRGEHADMGRVDRPLTGEELAIQQKSMAAAYDVFISKVALGRGLKKERVDEVGGGRVWTGEQALEIGLADKLGGFDTAADEVLRLLGEPGDARVNLMYKPERITLWKLLTGKIEASVIESRLSPEETRLLRELRLGGIWRPGQALAVMPDPLMVR